MNSPPPKSISLQVKKAIELSQWKRPLSTPVFLINGPFLNLDGSWQKGIVQQPKPGIWLWYIRYLDICLRLGSCDIDIF